MVYNDYIMQPQIEIRFCKFSCKLSTNVVQDIMKIGCNNKFILPNYLQMVNYQNTKGHLINIIFWKKS